MATSRTRTKAAKPAEAAPAPAPEPAPEAVVEPVVNADGETVAEIVQDGEPDVVILTKEEAAELEAAQAEAAAESDAPRQTPAAAELEPPAQPAPAPAGDGKPRNVINDNSGQLSVDMVMQSPNEIRKELYNYATGEVPDPDEVFKLEFEHGRSVICRIRLCERLWGPGMTEPMSRLVMAAGQRTDRAYADQIVAILRAQIGAGTPAEDADDEPNED